MKINTLWRLALLGGMLGGPLPPAGAEPSGGMALTARIQALTCVLALSVEDGGTALNWQVGLMVRPDGSARVVDGLATLRRQVVVSFQNPGWQQLNPLTGGAVDCTSAQSGVAISFTARDTPATLNQPHKDARMGLIPAAGAAASGARPRYFEYYVTYAPAAMQAAAGSAMTLAPPPDGGQYRDEQVMPLHGVIGASELRLMFRPEADPAHRLGRYPFNVWLKSRYSDPGTAPRADAQDNRYLSSLTVTASWR